MVWMWKSLGLCDVFPALCSAGPSFSHNFPYLIKQRFCKSLHLSPRMQLLVVILPIVLNDFNTTQALFTKSPANQLDHESDRVTQEQKGKSLTESCTESVTHSKLFPAIPHKPFMETNILCKNRFLGKDIFYKADNISLISAIKCIQNLFYIRVAIVSRNDFFVGDLVQYYAREVFPALK